MIHYRIENTPQVILDTDPPTVIVSKPLTSVRDALAIFGQVQLDGYDGSGPITFTLEIDGVAVPSAPIPKRSTYENPTAPNQIPIHVQGVSDAAPGAHTVTLIVTNGAGASITITQASLTIIEGLKKNFDLIP